MDTAETAALFWSDETRGIDFSSQYWMWVS
jgi:hypothetical protein